MAAKTNLNARNLEALGAERLAQLLIEISTGDAVAKRRQRLALAGAQSPRAAAQEIAKRLTSIARARSVITWENRKALITDLEAQRRAIVEQVAPTEPDEALALMWAPAHLRRARTRHRRLRCVRDARRLCRPAERAAWPQARLLVAHRGVMALAGLALR